MRETTLSEAQTTKLGWWQLEDFGLLTARRKSGWALTADSLSGLLLLSRLVGLRWLWQLGLLGLAEEVGERGGDPRSDDSFSSELPKKEFLFWPLASSLVLSLAGKQRSNPLG